MQAGRGMVSKGGRASLDPREHPRTRGAPPDQGVLLADRKQQVLQEVFHPGDAHEQELPKQRDPSD